MQMAASGIAGALIPSTMGILARRISLEAIPVCMVVLFVALFLVYLLSMRRSKQLKLMQAQESVPAD
jgi:hypothetical protein